MHALVQDIAPQQAGQGGSDDVVGPRLGRLERGHHVADQVLDHEAADPRAGIDRGEDEQRLEQDGEVVPDARQRLPPRKPDRMVAMPTASVGAPPVRDMIVASPTSCAICVSMSGVTVKPHERDHLRRMHRVGADQPGAAVHGEIHAGMDHRGGDHRHDGDQRFHQHRRRSR